MEGYQEPAEPDTPTSVASSTRYRGLPTWPAETNEQDCHSVKLLQSFEQNFEDGELRKHEHDVDELAKWVQSQTQNGLYEEYEQSWKERSIAQHWELRHSRRRPRRSARIRQRERTTGIYYGVRRSKRIEKKRREGRR